MNTDGVLLGAWASLPDSGTVLDIGTGSGIIALIMAQKGAEKVIAIDIHEASAIEAAQNFKGSRWNDKLQSRWISFHGFIQSNTQTFSAIVCNPPFFAKSLLSGDPEKNLVKHEQQLGFTSLMEGVSNRLSADGSFACIIPSYRSEELEQIASSLFLFCHRKTGVIPKAGKPVFRVMFEFRGFEPLTRQENCLIIRDLNNNYTPEYKKLTKEFYLEF